MLCNSKFFKCLPPSRSERWFSYFRTKKGKMRLKQSSTDKALEHFDDFYKPLFNKKWPSIRLGLLTDRKYVAAVNNFSQVDDACNYLENLGAINIKRFFEVETIKILEKKINSKKKLTKSSDHLESAVAEISKKKAEEEHKELYPDGDETKLDSSLSSRYVDPSISVNQLHEYMPATELKGSDDYLRESTHYSYYPTDTSLSVRVIRDHLLPFPEHLHLYTFEPGNTSLFPQPRRGDTGVSDYFLLDGGSVLPVLALDLQPDDMFLDMCAAPGGKSFLAVQTLRPQSVVCNDVSESRLNRVRRVMKEFLYDYEEKLSKGFIKMSHQDARTIDAPGYYNKILVDVPCTTDRHSANEDDNNIFNSSRLKERIKLPEIQSEILLNALRQVAVGGTVVYSTCSLSPIQNDGVVHMALQKIAEEGKSEFVVVDMATALQPGKLLFTYANVGLRYGHLIVPNIVNNFGPTYFCKLIKVS